MSGERKPPRSKDPRLCPACLRSGFTRGTTWNGRPHFRCQSCEHEWTCGRDGAPYLGNEQNKGKPNHVL